LFRGEIDILNDRDGGKETIPPANQFPAQNIGGNQSDQIEQEEEANDSHSWEMKYAVKESDVYVGDQGVKNIIQGIEDELQNEKGNSEGQDDQDPCKNLCSKMF
jgi:hypothetical protein